MSLPPPFRRLSPAAANAFTLVELIVSMTVLTLLIVFVSQLISATTSVTTSNRQHLDADGQARLVFDRMALDFARMVKRPDVDYIFNVASNGSPSANDEFFFYSEAPAYFDLTAVPSPSAQSSLALIGYRINNASQPNPYQLARLGKGLTWDESAGTPAPGGTTDPSPGAIVFLSYPAARPSPAATPTPFPASTLAGHWPNTLGTSPNYIGTDNSDFYVISPQVCRLEICFLLKGATPPSTAAQPIPTPAPAAYSLTPYYPWHTSINGLQDVQAIVVAMVVLDQTSRQIAPNLSNIATALPSITAANTTASPPVLMAQYWQSIIDQGSQGSFALAAQIPQRAAAQLRIYQRHFYLNTQDPQ